MFFSLKVSEKGVFFKVENTDGLHVLHLSGGTGTNLPQRVTEHDPGGSVTQLMTIAELTKLTEHSVYT